MVYSHCRTLFATFTRAPRVPSLYPHLSTVMLVHRLCLYSLLTNTGLDADIVCSRSKHHFDPQLNLDLNISETATNTTEAANNLERYRQAFKPTHERQKKLMYFC